jgi:predicted HicB family RNase H-like nuclease
MPRQRPAVVPPTSRASEVWPVLAVRVPADWKRWLEEAAGARGLSVAALVRQCIRELMIRRHDSNGGAGS